MRPHSTEPEVRCHRSRLIISTQTLLRPSCKVLTERTLIDGIGLDFPVLEQVSFDFYSIHRFSTHHSSLEPRKFLRKQHLPPLRRKPKGFSGVAGALD